MSIEARDDRAPAILLTDMYFTLFSRSAILLTDMYFTLFSRSADLLRLEKDNKHLQSIVDAMGVPDSRIKGLADYKRNLAENIIYYKNLIGKLIKVGSIIILVIILAVVLYEVFIRK